jgi:hypothetical protein
MSEVKNNRTAMNKRLKGERHAKRMAAQSRKVGDRAMLGVGVPRGTARAARRNAQFA